MSATEENFVLDLGIGIAPDSFHTDVRSSLLPFSPTENLNFSHDTGSAEAVASLPINKPGTRDCFEGSDRLSEIG